MEKEKIMFNLEVYFDPVKHYHNSCIELVTKETRNRYLIKNIVYNFDELPCDCYEHLMEHSRRESLKKINRDLPFLARIFVGIANFPTLFIKARTNNCIVLKNLKYNCMSNINECIKSNLFGELDNNNINETFVGGNLLSERILNIITKNEKLITK